MSTDWEVRMREALRKVHITARIEAALKYDPEEEARQTREEAERRRNLLDAQIADIQQALDRR